MTDQLKIKYIGSDNNIYQACALTHVIIETPDGQRFTMQFIEQTGELHINVSDADVIFRSLSIRPMGHSAIGIKTIS